nr:TetR/AcrR family transcriptional regulator [uncultured Niameybacter sp.]
MQILKEEMRESIINIAEQEFLKRGFKEASMRSIAKKANTTQGNLYNYFSSKEALLDAVVGELPKTIERFFKEHDRPLMDLKELETWNEEKFKEAFEQLGFDRLLSKPFIILMEGCIGTKYESYRKEFLKLGKEHILEHLGDVKKEKLAGMLAVSFLEALIFIGKSQHSLQEGKKAFIEYCNLFILGMLKGK